MTRAAVLVVSTEYLEWTKREYTDTG